jgi:hypothetical protein
VQPIEHPQDHVFDQVEVASEPSKTFISPALRHPVDDRRPKMVDPCPCASVSTAPLVLVDVE